MQPPPATAGPARIGNEMLLLLGEDVEVAIAGLALLGALGGPRYDVDPAVLRRAVALLPADRPHAPLLLAAVAGGVPEGWHVANPGPVLDAARDPASHAEAMRAADRPSALHALLRRRSAEAIALAGAHGVEHVARRWFDELSRVRLEIGGEDLIRAGVEPGPEMGRRLEAALARKLDEGLEGRDAELAAALEG